MSIVSPVNNQWIRRYSLVVGNDQVQIDLSQLRFRFKIHSSDVETPNHAEITVTNLAPGTSQQIQQEFTSVTLQAGYVNGAYGTIFQGDIREFERGKENATDSFLTILAADGDLAYIKGIVNKALAAGQTAVQQLTAITGQLTAQLGPGAIVLGPLLGLSLATTIRGKSLYGMARDVIRRIAETNGVTWSIQGGALVTMPRTGAVGAGVAYVLNSQTGMIGIPKQTVDGIVVKSLLNPNVVIGSTVQINQNDIDQTIAAKGNQLSNTPGLTSFIPYNTSGKAGPQTLVTPTADGFYRVMAIDREGDTRGTPWYNDMICSPIDGTLPLNPSSRILQNLP